ncbi:DUF4844 domain-containing protein [Hymenobacter monticola]|uniref:DUF4844 domain-containing protein n=1 Tax=Hymenobacter monticola TaxID=1705399 RepID=A0ABY4BAF8_9BACT|nr:DUF4844 domain-containing protein [Hymenobacter monticola]UOE34666.1 DUF4844 domain-containing protein [Hymenobacter monticola]
MRKLLLAALIFLAGNAYAQTSITIPSKAASKLEKLLKQTQDAVVVGKKAAILPVEARPMTNRMLAQSTSDFLALATRTNPTKEAFLQSLDAGLSRINPLMKTLEDRQQTASFYQDLLDLVGIESSEGRLTAFVEAEATAKQ